MPETNDSNAGRNPDKTRSSRASKVGLSRTAIIVIAVVITVVVAFLVAMLIKSQRQTNAAELQAQELLMDMAQQDLEREYNDLNSEFEAFENQRRLVIDDSVRRELNDKYEAARLQIEQLQQQLADNRRHSAAEIQRLRDEISTLRNLLRHYVEEINRLNQENEALRAENREMRERNEQLNNRVVQTTRRNEELSERMTLAERLNVTGLTLIPLNKKGRQERKLNKVKQLEVKFTIPQNNSTPVGEKTIFLRITSPSGQLLGNGGTFAFEGGNVSCTAQKTIEYSGEEIGGISIYYDVDTPLISGDYTVELFADNFRLISKNFTLE